MLHNVDFLLQEPTKCQPRSTSVGGVSVLDKFTFVVLSRFALFASGRGSRCMHDACAWMEISIADHLLLWQALS